MEAGGEFEGHAPGEDGDGHPASWATDARLYEGTVILLLEATTGIGQVIQFLRDLCMKPAIRLLKLVGNHGERVGVWVALREPLDLMGMLPKIEGVSLVTELRERSPADPQRTLLVQLTGGS